MQGWPRGSRAHTQGDLLDVAFRQRALNYPVGDYYSYTNTGYAIAMSLVERVSGMSFQAFSRERIFAPLGMTHTSWRDDFTRLVPGRAQAYANEDGDWHLAMPFESVVGPGGMLTTAGDWLIWNDALAKKTLGAAWADSLHRRMRLTSGRQIRYALGLFVGEYRGVPEVSHSGSTAGYSTFLARYPDRGNLSIAVLCNSANASPARYVRELADRLITDFPAPTAPDTTAADSLEFARYVGIYRDDRTHASLEVAPTAWKTFRALPGEWFGLGNGSRWRFDGAPGAHATGIRIAQPDGDTLTYTFVAGQFWKPTAVDLAAFEGSYRNEELGVTYQASVAGDALTLSMRPGTTLRLQPTYPDGFTVRGRAVWFTRDRRRRITEMHVGESRVWDMRFSKTR
jgi:hypothetical protein